MLIGSFSRFTLSHALVLLATSSTVVALSACSSAGPTLINGCDESKCAKDNKCITLTVAGKAETKCRLTCSDHTGAQGCPFGYRCATDGKVTAGPIDYCAPLSFLKTVTKKATGQWGAGCSPVNGGIASTDCDTDQGFKCFAKLPTDANAICTTFDCTSDNDCPGSFYCGTVNTAPNAEVAVRTVGDTHTACLPREHCAPCVTDFDCGANRNGVSQRCVADSSGKTFCGATCTVDGNCPDDAVCSADLDGVCSPKVGHCPVDKGNAGYCEPCRSDADCEAGVCVSNENTSEKFCASKSATPCSISSDNKMVMDCPKPVLDKHYTTCSTKAADGLPKDLCLGYVPFAASAPNDGGYLGCYSRTRKP